MDGVIRKEYDGYELGNSTDSTQNNTKLQRG